MKAALQSRAVAVTCGGDYVCRDAGGRESTIIFVALKKHSYEPYTIVTLSSCSGLNASYAALERLFSTHLVHKLYCCTLK